MKKFVLSAIMLLGIVSAGTVLYKEYTEKPMPSNDGQQKTVITDASSAKNVKPSPIVQNTASPKPSSLPSQINKDMVAQTQAGYSGTILDGQSKTLVVEFTHDDYTKALTKGQIIVLLFYTDGCTICEGELGQLKVGSSELNDNNIITFRVHYKDSKSNAMTNELAIQFGVSEENTKVVLKNGQPVVKSSEWWNEDKFETQVKAFLQ